MAGRHVVEDRFRWSGQIVPLQKFAQKYCCHLPVVMLVHDGFSGRDERLHQLCSDEVYWVYGCEVKKRFILRDSSGRYVTVPRSYTGTFQVLYADGSTSDELSVEQAIIRCAESNRHRIIFTNNQSVDYGKGAEQGGSERLGALTFQDAYEQIFFLCHPLQEGELSLYQQIIPDYVPVDVDYCVGFQHADDSEFRRFMKRAFNSVEKIEHKKVDIADEILLFDTPPVEEYAEAGDLETVADSLCDWRAEVDDTPVIPPRSDKLAASLKGIIPYQDELDSLYCGRDIAVKMIRLYFPPPIKLTSDDDDDYVDVAAIESKPPPRPRPRSPTNKPLQNSYFSRPKPFKVPPPKLPKPKLDKKPPPSPPSDVRSSAQRSQSVSSSSSSGWGSAADIPLNTSSFTVDEVRLSLELLGLQGYCEAFAEKCIDGQLLLSLEDDILVDTFGLTRFEAVKLRRFCHDDWRPKFS